MKKMVEKAAGIWYDFAFPNIIEYSVTNELMTIGAANEYFNITNYMMQSAIGLLVGGLVLSAIAALILRRK